MADTVEKEELSFLLGLLALSCWPSLLPPDHPRAKPAQSKAEIREGERFPVILFEHLDPFLPQIRCTPGLVRVNRFYSFFIKCELDFCHLKLK